MPQLALDRALIFAPPLGFTSLFMLDLITKSPLRV